MKPAILIVNTTGLQDSMCKAVIRMNYDAKLR